MSNRSRRRCEVRPARPPERRPAPRAAPPSASPTSSPVATPWCSTARKPTTPLAEALGAAFRFRPLRPDRVWHRPGVPHRLPAAAAHRRHRRGAHHAGARPHGAARRLRHRRHRSTHRLRHARALRRRRPAPGLARRRHPPRRSPSTPHTALVAVTHDPKIDDYPLAEALRSGAFYVGALGSRKTHAKRVERLTAVGLDPDLITPHPRAHRPRHRRGLAGRDRRVRSGGDHHGAQGPETQGGLTLSPPVRRSARSAP